MSKDIILGIDFSNKYTQVAYVDDSTTPRCISLGTKDNYLIPTVVNYNREFDEWSAGDEALNRYEEQSCSLYWDLLSQCMYQPEKITKEALTVFFSYLIELSKMQTGGRSVRNIVVSVNEVTPQVADILMEVLCGLDYCADDIKIISHSESFVYYVLHQSKDIRVNQVYYLDFSTEGFCFRKLKTVKGKDMRIVYVDVTDLSEKLTVSDVQSNMAYADTVLFEYLDQCLKQDVVSGVYFSGEGFYEEGWDKTLALVCRNRRVFKGNNLFVKGAAYGADELFRSATLEKHLIVCKGRTRVQVVMPVKYKEQEHTVMLSNVGDYWSRSKSKVECILESVDSVHFEVRDLQTGTSGKFEIDLSAFPKRPEKTTRVEVDFKYLDENTFEIGIKDLGFGEFFESSGMEVKKAYSL